MNLSRQKIGPLDCCLVSNLPSGMSPRLLVILNHGFGASAEDLIDFAPFLIDFSELIEQGCQFVFPGAPVDLGPSGMPGGRAWWPINMAKLAEINQTRNFDQLTRLEPEGMANATGQLMETTRELQRRFGLDDSRTVIGGFSQGAMVSTNLVLRSQVSPALLAVFSGTLLCRDEWQKLAESHPGCQVLQSHGRQDPILPLVPAQQLQALLTGSGFSVEFCEFNGPHTIPMPVLQRLGERLNEILGQLNS